MPARWGILRGSDGVRAAAGVGGNDMKVAVVGATGLIGRRLVDALRRDGHAVIAVSRHGSSVADAPGVAWDPATAPMPPAALAGADAVVNLAGAGIGDARWTAERKALIISSRQLTTRGIVAALASGAGPRVLVNASAVGYYGTGEEPRTESSAPGDDFLAETCLAWEEGAFAARAHGVRVAVVRFGIVLAREGGALKKQLPLFRVGLGGPIGGGRQWVSWVHINDAVGVLVHALTHDMSGAFNAVAPNPVRQAEFAKAVGAALRRPAVLPTPAFALRLAMGEMATLALDGQQVRPEATLAAGYAFRHADVREALRYELTDRR